MSKQKTAINPTRAENYAEWYQQVVVGADLAENSPVRGCMIIRPWGYTLWENMQRALDDMFKATGHQNAYFPLFIPLSFFQKEAAHVEGFPAEQIPRAHYGKGMYFRLTGRAPFARLIYPPPIPGAPLPSLPGARSSGGSPPRRSAAWCTCTRART